MAKTLLQAQQQAINSLKEQLTKMDGARFPDKFARKAAQLRRLEKALAKQQQPAPEPSKSSITHQQSEILKQLAVGVPEERQRKLINQFAELAGWGNQFPEDDLDALRLRDDLVTAVADCRRRYEAAEVHA